MNCRNRWWTGHDPKSNHPKPRKPAKKSPKTDNGGSTAASSALKPAEDIPQTGNGELPAVSNCLKRVADGSSESSRKTPKVHEKSTPGGSTSTVRKTKRRRPRTGETKDQRDAYLQVGRYLLEMFSVPAFRSHATIGLVDKHRVQFLHANHSVILVSSAIDFLDTAGLDKFIAVLIAFNRLSLAENGILDPTGGKPFTENQTLLESNEVQTPSLMQEKKKLTFEKKGKEPAFSITYGEVISHEPSLAGRGTAVLHAQCSRWRRNKLVVKISWPGAKRAAEHDFVYKATEIAKNNDDHNWAVNHLPKIFFTRDVVFDSNSTHGKVADLFDGAQFANGGFEYERRTQRIIIQERLYPLKNLSNVRDIAQVLLDVACSMYF